MLRFGSNRPHDGFAALACGAAALLVLGCDYTGISAVDRAPVATPRLGSICSLGAATSAPTSVTLDSASTGCPSHLCLRPSEEQTTDTSALCTQPCNDDSDCQGGVARDAADPADRACVSGFACRVPIPNLSGLPYACARLCVCKDFLDPTQPATPPAGCP